MRYHLNSLLSMYVCKASVYKYIHIHAYESAQTCQPDKVLVKKFKILKKHES